MRLLSHRSRNRFDAQARALEVFQLFDFHPWYGGGFRKGWRGYTSLEGVFTEYAAELTVAPVQQELIRAHAVELRFLDYDCRLNDIGPRAIR